MRRRFAMDAREARAARIKMARREILRVLLTMYPIGPFDFGSICGSLAHLELPDNECVKSDLLYLCDKGYVRWTNKKPQTPWSDRLYKLTANGNEIANRIQTDPALEP